VAGLDRAWRAWRTRRAWRDDATGLTLSRHFDFDFDFGHRIEIEIEVT
jgi:hypothetical protein